MVRLWASLWLSSGRTCRRRPVEDWRRTLDLAVDNDVHDSNSRTYANKKVLSLVGLPLACHFLPRSHFPGNFPVLSSPRAIHSFPQQCIFDRLSFPPSDSSSKTLTAFKHSFPTISLFVTLFLQQCRLDVGRPQSTL